MAVAVSATGTKLIGGSSVTSINYTGITVAGGDTCLVATLVTGASAATSAWAATWDNGGTNQAMTIVKSQVSGNAVVVIFALRNPTSGNKTLALSWTTAQFPTVCAQSYTGSETASDGAAFLHAAGNTTTTINITSATNNRAICAFGNTGAFTGGLSQTSIYFDATSSGCDSAASQAAGAASVTFTATGATGSTAIAGFDLSVPGAVTLVTGWQNTDGAQFYKKSFLDQQPPGFVSNFQSTSSIAGIAWSQPPDQALYSRKVRDFVAPAQTMPNAVTVGIAGNAWYEPFDIPVYGKPLRDFVAPAFTEPVAVTVGISGMAWYEPFDQPFYGKKLRDFVPPAFTVPNAVTVGISGMSWFEPFDVPVYGKPLRDNTSPAFTAPVTPAVGISGMAWFEPFDIPVYGKPLRDFIAPSFTSQFVIAGISGIAWFVREDVYKRKPTPVDDPPSRAIQFTNQTVGISGMSWFEPFDIPVYGKPLRDNTAPAYTTPATAYVVTASFNVSDTIFIRDPLESLPPTTVRAPVLTSASFNVSDTIFLPDPPLSPPPSAAQFPVITIRTSFNVSDTIFIPDPPVSLPPTTRQRPVFTSISFNVSDTIFLPDPPLSPSMAGEVGLESMTTVWEFIASDMVVLPDPTITFAPAWDPKFTFQQTVGISGMAWFTPPDFAQTRIVNYTPPPGWDPQFVFQVPSGSDQHIVKFIGNVGHFMIR